MAAVLLFRTYIIKNGMQFFRKRAKKRQNSKIFENLGKNVQNLKIFCKRAASYVQLLRA